MDQTQQQNQEFSNSHEYPRPPNKELNGESSEVNTPKNNFIENYDIESLENIDNSKNLNIAVGSYSLHNSNNSTV